MSTAIGERRVKTAVIAAAGVGCLSLLLLAFWTMRSPAVGIANNGDWFRYVCPADLVPEPNVSFEAVPERLVPGECESLPYDSSFVLVLRWSRAIDSAVTGPPLALWVLAAGWIAIVSSGWSWLCFELVRRSRHPSVPIGAVVAAVVVTSDISFSSYYRSAYAEAMVFALLPVIAAAVIRVGAGHRGRWPAGVVLAASTILVTTAKSQMALTALVVLAAVLVLARGRRVSVPIAGAAALGALAATIYSVGFIAGEGYEEANTVNLVFSAVLTEVEDPRGFLVDLGVPDDAATTLAGFEGVGYWPIENGPRASPAFDDFDENVTRGAVIASAVSEPSIVLGMLQEAIGGLDDPRLAYLANHAEPDRDGFLADRPESAGPALRSVTLLPWWLVPALWLAAAGVAVRTALRGALGARTAAVVFFLALFTAASQTGLAVADGYYELAKHLVVAQHAHAILVAVLVGGGVGHVISTMVGRRSDRSSGGEVPSP